MTKDREMSVKCLLQIENMQQGKKKYSLQELTKLDFLKTCEFQAQDYALLTFFQKTTFSNDTRV